MANRVVIMLGGVRYPLRTVEDPAYVSALAGEMDVALRKVMGEGNLSLSEALILLGLEYLDSHKKAEANLDNMRGQVAEYMDAVKRAESELSEAKEAAKRLQKQLAGQTEAVKRAEGELSQAREEIKRLQKQPPGKKKPAEQ